ncbi:hypothetical protein JCGZ_03279 [Jatropha curcas]|uniref:Uncharacterized protein n=1 Tax=Jatropha curcas TaxID=180498 RepID=A0A067JDK3_JATCU|nr:hypothetical protein JCGZ_03279 [Jatropha curcas]
MSQLYEIPASAYTPEMETFGAPPDILTFDGEPMPVSRNPLNPGTRPLQLLPSPGTEFPVRVFDTPVVPAWPRVPHAPPRHMCLLEGLTREDLEVEYRGFSANDFLSIGDFPSYFASRMQARLPEVLESWRMEVAEAWAASRLQAEVERLRTRLEVEGIPLDSSDEDEDGSSFDGAPLSPPHPTVAGPSRRRR